MQIYGDNCCDGAVGALATVLLARIDAEQELASLRAILIGCGQLEQLIWDAGEFAHALRAVACGATESAAAAFYSVWSRQNGNAPRPSWHLDEPLRDLRSRVAELARAEGIASALKVPEGFAFYAVYPEQYCAAAVAFVKRRRQTQGVTQVIGLRSIGTTLSAAVAVVLKAADIEHGRYTVRPHGHPFDRQSELPGSFAREDVALVVDEGPGLSGSSFFSVGRALDTSGVTSERQVYFCAHPHPPGRMASPEIDAFWGRAERYAASNYQSAVGREGTLHSCIKAELARRFGSPVEQLDDVSAGRWRGAAFGESTWWPPAYPAFERPKLLARLADGRRVLLKYFGQVLRSDPVTRRIEWSDASAVRQVTNGGWKALGIHGYVARLWLDGELLSASERSSTLLEQLAQFLANRPWQRAREGCAAADGYYGAAGSLAPLEWLKRPNGRVIKLPGTLVGYDHTVIDAEPLGWDLAAAVVEWQLTDGEVEYLLSLFRTRSGIEVDSRELLPHIQRYARFNSEKARFCAGQALGVEAARLQAEAERYASHDR